MTDAALIPDRRRKHFPLNGGPRLTETERCKGRSGIKAARDVLDATEPGAPGDQRVQKQLTAEQVSRARAGIAAARAALQQDEAFDDDPLAA